jgi:hypothetical protein
MSVWTTMCVATAGSVRWERWTATGTTAAKSATFNTVSARRAWGARLPQRPSAIDAATATRIATAPSLAFPIRGTAPCAVDQLAPAASATAATAT